MKPAIAAGQTKETALEEFAQAQDALRKVKTSRIKALLTVPWMVMAFDESDELNPEKTLSLKAGLPERIIRFPPLLFVFRISHIAYRVLYFV
jgi:hypothetical protein